MLIFLRIESIKSRLNECMYIRTHIGTLSQLNKCHLIRRQKVENLLLLNC